MDFDSIIEKKKHKKELTKGEINYFIEEYCKENIKDYQASALLMAIVLNGMSDKETIHLTKAIIKSGATLDLSHINGIKVDKHSSGGVGDKTSLVLVPLLASLGFKVVKMSGKGLGHTGGTIDKLNSIKGYNTELGIDEFINQIDKVGCSIISQSDKLAYADKKLYALRDVTGTVDSLPLIASSIMAKKIALGSDLICLDVTFGSGAFFKNKKQALEASRLMIKIGKKCHKKVKAIITSMEQPLGNSIGNRLEVNEALDTLLNKGPSDLKEICIEFAKVMIKETKLYPDDADLDSIIESKFTNREAYNKFLEMIKAQGGDIEYNSPSLVVTEIRANKEGYINHMDTLRIGQMLVELGGGRKYKGQEINYDVGSTINKKINDYIHPGDSLFTVYSLTTLNEDIINKFKNSIFVSDKENTTFKEIYKVI